MGLVVFYLGFRFSILSANGWLILSIDSHFKLVQQSSALLRQYLDSRFLSQLFCCSGVSKLHHCYRCLDLLYNRLSDDFIYHFRGDHVHRHLCQHFSFDSDRCWHQWSVFHIGDNCHIRSCFRGFCHSYPSYNAIGTKLCAGQYQPWSRPSWQLHMGHYRHGLLSQMASAW